MPKGPDDHINELDAEVAALRSAIQDALMTLEIPTPQAVAAAVEILRGALTDGSPDA